MKKIVLNKQIVLSIVFLFILFFITGCTNASKGSKKLIASTGSSADADGGFTPPDGNTPNDPVITPPLKTWTDGDVDNVVAVEQVRIYSPLTNIDAHPSECDYINYQRYRVKDANGVIPVDKLDAALLCMPGMYGGAGSFGYIARQWVYMAKAIKNAAIEVWVYDDRSGGLEDATGMTAAIASRNPGIALDYYINGKAVNGKTFAGFLEPHDIRFLSEFGLGVYMKDLYTIMNANMPDQGMRKQKLHLVGHCMGGFLTHTVAGWDFDGDPATTADAGYNNFASLVNLDGAITGATDLLRVGLNMLPTDLVDSLISYILDKNFNGFVQSMRTGYFPVVTNQLVSCVGAKLFAVFEIAAMKANWSPGEESTLLRDLPYSANLDFVLRVMFSRNWSHFFSGTPSMEQLRFTNEALFAQVFDNNSMFINSLQTGMGFLYGGELAEKKFPNKDLLARIQGFEKITALIMSKDPLYLASNAGPSIYTLGQGPLYRWMKFDQVPEVLTDSTGAVLTRARNENADVQDLARAFYSRPFNYTQWYFPFRIMADLFAANLDSGQARENCINFFYADGSERLPKIEIITENGPFYDTLKELGWKMVVAEGYNHLDPIIASCNRRDRRDSMFGLPVLDFVLQKK